METSLLTPQIIGTPSLEESLASSTTNDFMSPILIPERHSKDDSSDKTLQIAQELQNSVTHQCRKPTESIFFPRNKSNNHIQLQNSVNMNPVNNPNEPLIEPSTADVLKDLLTFDNKDSSAEQTLSETSQSTPSTPNVPLKKRIIVSQTVNEVPNFLVQSQTVPNDLYVRNNEVGVVKQEIDSSTESNPNFHSTFQHSYPIDSTHIQPMGSRAPVTVINGKRTFQQAFNGTVPMNNNLPVETMSFPLANEVTSSGQVPVKRRSMTSQNPTNAKTVHANHSASRSTRANSQTIVDQDPNNEDSRRQQIRDSNREAARRCRERRRHYIEQLESDLEKQKLEMQRLAEKLLIAERENAQLRTILKEANIGSIRRHPN